jgi:hypothetical protein
MSYLHWELDLEDGFDAIDPLGMITIIGDEGRIIEECTNLDTFCEALVSGVQGIQVGQTLRVDPLEADDIVFTCSTEYLEILYGSQAARILDRPKFVADLRETVVHLVTLIDEFSLKAGQEQRKLENLRTFLSQS